MKSTYLLSLVAGGYLICFEGEVWDVVVAYRVDGGERGLRDCRLGVDRVETWTAGVMRCWEQIEGENQGDDQDELLAGTRS